MSKTKRRDKARRRAEAQRTQFKSFVNFHCMNCGERGGGHFVGPSFGDPGFYICKRKDADV